MFTFERITYVLQFMEAFIMSWTMATISVYMFRILTPQDLGLVHIIGGVLACSTLVFATKLELLKKYWKTMLILGCLVDNITELMLFYNPLYKLIGDIISASTVTIITKVLVRDAANHHWNKEGMADLRTNFKTRLDLFGNIGKLLGGAGAVIVTLTIVPSVWLNVLCMTVWYIGKGYVINLVRHEE